MPAQELFTTNLIDDANLELYLRLNGNFNDSSGNGFNGTGSTSPTSVPSGGKFSGGYDFNGTTDCINVTMTGKTPFATPWSFNGWIEPDTLGEGSSGDYGRIFDFTGKCNLRFDSESGDNMKLVFQPIFTGTNGGWRTDDFVIPKNAYSMVTVNYDGSDVTNDPIIYVNGEEVAITEYSTPTGTIDPGTGLKVGNNTSSGVRAYDGAMDDLVFLSRFLTPYEINLLYDFVPSPGASPIFFGRGFSVG